MLSAARRRLLTMDVTNTIIRVRGSVGDQYSIIAERHGVQLDPAKVNIAFRSAYKKQNSKLPNFGVHSNLSAKEWWLRVVKSVLRSQSVSIGSDKFALLFEEIYQTFATRAAWEMGPDMCDVLRSIRNIGPLQLAVVSNNDQRLHDILEDLHISHLFDYVLTSAEVGHAKPSAAIFQKALSMAQCEPRNAFHIGDSYELDYVAPRRLEINAYLLDPKRSHEDVQSRHHSLDSVSQIVPILKSSYDTDR